MGLFGLKKKSDPLASIGSGNSQMPDFNMGLNSNTGMGGMGSRNPYSDSSIDMNSGLKLADLNNPSQDMGFGGQQSGVDSFGNVKPQQKFENFEYKAPQQVSSPDTSKDLQLILAKLDTIRSEITNINHRLDNIERQQKEPQPLQKKYPW